MNTSTPTPPSENSPSLALAPEITSPTPFPHFMRDGKGKLKVENGQPMYADNGGDSQEVERERAILTKFLQTGEIPSKYFMRENGTFKRGLDEKLVYADNGGSSEEIAAEEAMIEFLLAQRQETSIGKVGGKVRKIWGMIFGEKKAA